MLLYPNAKINIGLFVTGKRPDGYHNLETVFYPVPLRDVLEIKPVPKENVPYLFQTVGYDIAGRPEDNLVIRIYEDMKAEFDLPPLDIYLQKRIPMGAGLGGGSSDAAFMMRALNEEFHLGLTDDELARRVAKYGADCAFFIHNRPAYATGIGDRLAPLKLSLKGWHIVLVKPDIFISTKEAYSGVTPQPAPCHLPEVVMQDVSVWKELISNDFEDSVFPKYPSIAAIKKTLYDMGAVYASMSGSGSTVFGLFRHDCEEAARVFHDCYVFRQKLLV